MQILTKKDKEKVKMFNDYKSKQTEICKDLDKRNKKYAACPKCNTPTRNAFRIIKCNVCGYKAKDYKGN